MTDKNDYFNVCRQLAMTNVDDERFQGEDAEMLVGYLEDVAIEEGADTDEEIEQGLNIFRSTWDALKLQKQPN